jgi:diaminopimelate decarboxylase
MPPAEREPLAPLATFAGVSLVDLASRFGTPTYVYDLDAMAREAEALSAAFSDKRHLIAYAVKANSAAPIIATFRDRGLGADVVSGPELRLARRLGVPPRAIVMSGVAKTIDEIDLCLAEDIGAIQVESVEELTRVSARARNFGKAARVSLRINPGLDDLDTHAHIRTGHDEAKFGIAVDDARAALSALPDAVHLVGLTQHIGSQFLTTREYLQGAHILFGLTKSVRERHALEFVDTGGGFGIDYGDGEAVPPATFVRETLALLAQEGLGDLALHVEPGRALVASHGVLLASVIQDKRSGPRAWLMVDAGMNDLMRPALYQAFHRVGAVVEGGSASLSGQSRYRVVGPVCESSDDFGDHVLAGVTPPRWVVLRDAGAYGFTMASRYNGRALPAEVFVRDGRVVAASDRESPDAWVEDRTRFRSM